MLTTIGIDANTGVARYTFGIPDILTGIDFPIIVVGLFGMTGLLTLVEHQARGSLKSRPVDKSFVNWADLSLAKWTILRSPVIGFIIGILPGAGASVASALAYGTEKRISDKNGSFGTGDVRRLAAPEAAHSAAAGGSMVPMLTLGIPGSGATAILLGALLMFNIRSGPMMFTQRSEVAWGLVMSMYIGNVARLNIKLPLVGLFARMLTIPQHSLTPLIAVLALIGIYTIVGNPHDLFMITMPGVFGWFLRKLEFSLAPVIFGFVLGSLFEDNLRRALSISGGGRGILVSNWTRILLYVLALLVMVLPIWLARRARKVSNDETATTDWSSCLRLHRQKRRRSPPLPRLQARRLPRRSSSRLARSLSRKARASGRARVAARQGTGISGQRTASAWLLRCPAPSRVPAPRRR
ncbi:putative tricarboxylic transport membrane protein [Salipiger aestuarii]|uniref:Putative tricarboxylic transport membrane protein n=1 Tax=Salipiger aestuarii TaxID=568098 RepID=A0A327XX00_9RHOB|nr:putative tricarboxylic transport membrane protein [Salipiger aestuarii]